MSAFGFVFQYLFQKTALRKKKLGFIPTDAWRFFLEKAGFWYSWSWKLGKSEGKWIKWSAVQHVEVGPIWCVWNVSFVDERDGSSKPYDLLIWFGASLFSVIEQHMILWVVPCVRKPMVPQASWEWRPSSVVFLSVVVIPAYCSYMQLQKKHQFTAYGVFHKWGYP